MTRPRPWLRANATAAAAVALVLAAAGCGGRDAEEDVAATVEGWGTALRDRDAAWVCELTDHRGDSPAECEADVRSTNEFGRAVRLDVRSVRIEGDTARATVRVVDPSQPESSTLRERTAPFGLRRTDGRWRVLISGR